MTLNGGVSIAMLREQSSKDSYLQQKKTTFDLVYVRSGKNRETSSQIPEFDEKFVLLCSALKTGVSSVGGLRRWLDPCNRGAV